ncbi:MAG: hypothetical protein WDM81_02595 [Rhizomicrobium sp.]
MDYSAATLRTLAEQQKPLSGRDLAAFERRHGLNIAETAAMLDVAERTVRSYREADALPEPIAVTLRVLDDDPTVFAGTYRPVERRGRGRPKKSRGRIAAGREPAFLTIPRAQIYTH